jgi:hypothetical protein
MAARYWVGGTLGGLWSDTAKWSDTSGGAGGFSVPGSADTAIFNSVSGAGPATVDSNVTIQTLTTTGWTGTLAFGTNTISLNSTGTVFTGDTTYSVTGTPLIKVITGGSTTITISPGNTTETNSVSFEIVGGTYVFNISSICKNLTFTGYSGSAAISADLYGSLTLSSTMTVSSSSTSSIGFIATSGVKTITTNNLPFGRPIVFNGVGGTWQLQDALTTSAIRTVTLTNGTLDLNGKTITTGLFASANANVRTLAFGSGNIVCNAAGGTLWTTATTTNLAVTGTPVVNISNSGTVATSVLPGALNETNSISFNFTTGAYALTFLGTASYAAKNVDFTGFAGTWGTTSTGIVYGNLTLSTGMTLTASASALRFGATSGTQVITTNAKTIDFPLTVNGIGGTVQLADALTLGATRALTLTNGTFDGNSKTISGASTFSMVTGSVTIKNISTALAFTLTSGALIQGAANTFGAFTWTLGNLDINNYQLNCSSFTTTGVAARTLAFGTGNITCVNAAGGTLFTTSTVASALIVTGTSTINISNNSANAATVTPGSTPEANSLSFNFIDGTYALTFMGNTSEAAKNVNFSGFAGTWSRGGLTKIYGNLTFSSAAGFSAAASANSLTFGATSGTQIITSNAKTHDYPITLNGVGGTVQLADALLMGTTRILSHTNGTLDLNGKTLTVGAQYQTAAGTKILTFNGGTLVCPASSAQAFNNASPTNFTTTAGTGTGKISMTAATAKTFVGGGSTYNCTLSNDGAGALTISGANTFTTIANGVQPTAFVFPISTTQTVTNWNVSGTAGNLVTITSGTAGTAATLSKASGTVSADYLSLKDSAATGGASWYAGANSTNVSGNSGWIFSAPPVVTAGGNFFFMF